MSAILGEAFASALLPSGALTAFSWTYCHFFRTLNFSRVPEKPKQVVFFDLSVARTVFSEAICQLHASTSSYASGNCQEQSSSVTISEQGREESQASTTDMPAHYNADQNMVTFIP